MHRTDPMKFTERTWDLPYVVVMFYPVLKLVILYTRDYDIS